MCEHHHHYTHQKNFKRLAIVLIITSLYMITEFIGGYYTNSLALMADAGHMLSDVISLLLSFIAIWIATKPAPLQKTFGYHRAEIISAFVNGLALVCIAGIILYESYERLKNGQIIQSEIMLLIAAGGFFVNLAGAYILHQGSKENLNVRGAFLHVVADLLGSIGAIVAGILMYFYNWYIADPIISIAIAILILISSFGIIKSAFNILMESVPENIKVEQLKIDLENIEGVENVHDLHIWCITPNQIILSVHITAEMEFSESILKASAKLIEEKYEIEHSTIQIEPNNFHKNECPITKQ